MAQQADDLADRLGTINLDGLGTGDGKPSIGGLIHKVRD